MANEWVWTEFEVVVFVIPAAGAFSTSVLRIVTPCVWALVDVEVKLCEVPPFGGVVELPHPVTPSTSRARRAAPERTAKTLFMDILISPLPS